MADFLIKAGADLELGASTPLMEASQEGHLDLVRYLLESGARVNAVTGEEGKCRCQFLVYKTKHIHMYMSYIYYFAVRFFLACSVHGFEMRKIEF